MKCSTIQCENVNRGHAATIIATNVENGVPFHSHKPRDEISIVSRFIDNCLLYTSLDHTQVLLQLVFQKFQKSFKVVFVYTFVANSFGFVSSKSFNLYRFLKIECVSLYTDPSP